MTTTKCRVAVVAACLAVVASLGACGVTTDTAARPLPQPFDVEPSPTIGSTDAAAGAVQQVATIWLVDGQSLVPRGRRVDAPATVTSIINKLVEGAGPREQAIGLRTALTVEADGSPLVSAANPDKQSLMGQGIAVVRLSPDFAALPLGEQSLEIGQLVLSLTSSGAQAVSFTDANGRSVSVPDAAGRPLSRPVMASDYEALKAGFVAPTPGTLAP